MPCRPRLAPPRRRRRGELHRWAVRTVPGERLPHTGTMSDRTPNLVYARTCGTRTRRGNSTPGAVSRGRERRVARGVYVSADAWAATGCDRALPGPRARRCEHPAQPPGAVTLVGGRRPWTADRWSLATRGAHHHRSGHRRKVPRTAWWHTPACWRMAMSSRSPGMLSRPWRARCSTLPPPAPSWSAVTMADRALHVHRFGRPTSTEHEGGTLRDVGAQQAIPRLCALRNPFWISPRPRWTPVSSQ